MPSGRRDQPAPAIPADVADWRPQVPGTRNARYIDDPIVEPFWDGAHVLAHVNGETIELRDEQGLDRTPAFAALAREVAAATLAESAIIDGFLTVQSMDRPPRDPAHAVTPRKGETVRQLIMGEHRSERLPEPEIGESSDDFSFVAVDLLQVDGDPLLEIPLLERKRLLESALQQTGRVVLSPFVQPPVESFRASCRERGFWALIYKSANSRYLPGAANPGWAIHRIPLR